MIIGLDFDNTIVDYDRVFQRVAVERGLVPATTPPLKNAVRDYLRQQGVEDAWTELQGYVYGCRMLDADLYPGVMECLNALSAAGHQLFIISHKTKTPFLGPAYDLHAAARDFLSAKKFYQTNVTGLSPDRVFFELTKEDKTRRIATCNCQLFLDDLPEILGHPGFPSATRGILFDPSGSLTAAGELNKVDSWLAFQSLVEHLNRTHA